MDYHTESVMKQRINNEGLLIQEVDEWRSDFSTRELDANAA